MIVNRETKQYQTRSDKPNENWLNNEWVLLNDNSEFANIIKANYPNVIITIHDDIITNVEIDNEALNKTNKQIEIEELKEQLSLTDYKAIKYAEGLITEEEYAPIKAQRQEWRNRINELEGSN